ncbi:MAG: hypothetical protein KGN80_05295 [Acidobacteriota bacterium]|nr:hypothetical protein [Acidobacteriota bacterium]
MNIQGTKNLNREWREFARNQKTFPDYQPSPTICFSRLKANPQIPQMTQIPKCHWHRKSNQHPSAPHGPTGFQGGGSLAPLVRKRRRPENPRDEVARPRRSRGGPCFISPHFASFNLWNPWNLWIHGPFRVWTPCDFIPRFVGVLRNDFPFASIRVESRFP